MRHLPKLLPLLAPLLVPMAYAWGPHSEITMAAVATLPADADLRQELGPELERLREYCWMGDMRRSLQRKADGWFYADDYLLFPAMNTHRDHLCPDVKATYDPYFRRALQALRTETPQNAARWIGAILHFTEDTGSPPHAGEIRGEVHSKMENWVDAKAIRLGDYQPRLLGTTEEEAVSGFLRRMDGLIDYSKQRAEKARPFVMAGDRPSTEPIVLESALETSRVVADLLFTLGKVAATPMQGATIRGRISGPAAPGFEKLPAKVMLLETNYSTLADANGAYEFRHLPTGNYSAGVLRVGCAPAKFDVTLPDTGAVEKNITLEPASVAGNIVRNATFAFQWLGKDRPDAWYPVRSRIDAPHWEGEMLPIAAGKTYRTEASWQDGATGEIVVRLFGSAGFSKPAVDSKSLKPGDPAISFTPAENGFAQVIVYANGSPAAVVRSVAITPAP